MKLTLLGTGTPVPDPKRHGPSQVIESGGELILIDCGAGSYHRLLEAGYLQPNFSRILLTHLHSDHITGICDILWAGWISRWWDEPPRLVGPPGTAQFIERLISAYEYDIKVRSGAERSPETLIPVVEEVEEGWSTSGGDWRLTAFRVGSSAGRSGLRLSHRRRRRLDRYLRGHSLLREPGPSREGR